MPIEIRELNIRLSVASNQEPSQEGPMQQEADGVNKEEIISECVEQILDILQNKMER